MDRRIEITGTSMNGKRGVATDFRWYRDNPSRDRYIVQLDDSGGTVKAPPGRVQAEPVEARPKAKGKGKKGRGKGGKGGK